MPKALSNFISIGFIALFLAVLAVAPRFLTRTSFSFPPPAAQESVPTVNIEQRLQWLTLPGNKVGSSRTLASAFGKHPTLIINFWATWCPPCIEELPSLEYLHRTLSQLPAGKRPKVITISVDQSVAEITDLFQTLNFKPTFPVFWDPEGNFARALGTLRFPETYWIDRSGKILHKWVGPQDWISDAVLRRLAEP